MSCPIQNYSFPVPAQTPRILCNHEAIIAELITAGFGEWLHRRSDPGNRNTCVKVRLIPVNLIYFILGWSSEDRCFPCHRLSGELQQGVTFQPKPAAVVSQQGLDVMFRDQPETWDLFCERACSRSCWSAQHFWEVRFSIQLQRCGEQDVTGDSERFLSTFRYSRI